MATDNKALTRRLIEEVWNKGNLEVINELVDPNYEGHDPMLGTLKRDGLREAVKSYRTAFPDLKIEVANIVAEGNYVCTRWISRGTNRGPLLGRAGTGKTVVLSGINLAEVRGGKLLVDRQEFDSASLLRQLGADVGAFAVPTGKPAVESTKRT